MAFVFSFFLRLFFCFLAAKLILLAFGAQSRNYLLGLTAIFLANVYWLDYASRRGRLPERRSRGKKQAAEPAATVPASPENPPETGQ
jgi:hypothetical protein